MFMKISKLLIAEPSREESTGDWWFLFFPRDQYSNSNSIQIQKDFIATQNSIFYIQTQSIIRYNF